MIDRFGVAVRQALALTAMFATTTAFAEDAAPLADPFNLAKLEAVVKRIDPEAVGEGGIWRFSYGDYQAQVISDPDADRIRVIVPVAEAGDLDEDTKHRLLQANFDTALDARYAIAQGVLWSTFIHPFATLTEDEMVNGIAQTLTLAATYGTTYSSGVLTFGGGDSAAEQRRFFEDILSRGLSI